MFANAARGMKAETAVEQAELLVKAIFTKWQKRACRRYEIALAQEYLKF